MLGNTNRQDVLPGSGFPGQRIQGDKKEIKKMHDISYLHRHELIEQDVAGCCRDCRRSLAIIKPPLMAFADKILTTDDPWKTLRCFPLYPRYEVLVHSMLRAMPPQPGGRLAFIGCGPVPVTLILLASKYNIPSVGLDSDRKTVNLARRVIRCLGLEKKIEIVAGDEWALDQLDWGMVLTAALAEPKARIFRNLRKILHDRGPAPVIYRTYSGMKAVLHEPVRSEDIAGFHVVDTVQPSGRVNNTTVFLVLDEP